MSNHGWQPLHKWKKVQEQAKTGQGSIGNSSPRQGLVPEEIKQGTRSATTGQGTVGPDTIKQIVRGPAATDQGPWQSTMGQTTEKSTEQPCPVDCPVLSCPNIHRSAPRQSTVGRIFDQEPTGQATPEPDTIAQGATGQYPVRRSTSKPRIMIQDQESIIQTEPGRAGQVPAMQGPSKKSIMEPMAKEQGPMRSRVTEFLDTDRTGPSRLFNEEPFAMVQAPMKQSTVVPGVMGQVPREYDTVSPFSTKPSAMGQLVPGQDVMRPFNIESSAMEQAAPGQDVMLPFNTEPSAVGQALQTQDFMRPLNTEPSTMGQAALEQDVLRPFITEPSATGQATGQDIMRPFSTEPSAMEESGPRQDVMRPFSTEPSTMEQAAPGQDIMRPFSTEPSAMGQAGPRQDVMRPVSTEPSVIRYAAPGQGVIRPLSTEPGAVGQAGPGEDVMKPFSTEPSVIRYAAPGQGVIRPLSTEPGAVGQAGPGEDVMKPFSTEPSTTGQAFPGQNVPFTIDPHAMGQATPGQNVIRPFSTEPSAMGQAGPKQNVMRPVSTESSAMGYAAPGQGVMRPFSTESGSMEQAGPRQDIMRPVSTEPSAMGQTAPGQGAMRPFSRQPGVIGQAAPGQGVMRPFSTDPSPIGQKAPGQDVKRPLSIGPSTLKQATPGKAGIRSYTTRPGTIGQAGPGSSVIKTFSTEPIAMRQMTPGQDVMTPLSTKPSVTGQAAPGQDVMRPFSTNPNATGQGVLGQDIMRPISTQPNTTSVQGIITPFNTQSNAMGQTGPGQAGIRPYSTQPGTTGQTAPGRSFTKPFSTEPSALKQAAPGLYVMKPFNTEPNAMGQAVPRQNIVRPYPIPPGTIGQAGLGQGTRRQYGPAQAAVPFSKRSAVVGTRGAGTEPQTIRENAIGPGAMGQSAPKPYGAWKQTDISPDSAQSQDDHYPLHRTCSRKTYLPHWIDLDRRPLPRWYDEAKVGIIIHWGLYSVPSYKSEWFWYLWKKGDREISEFMGKMYRAGFTYQEFRTQFRAQYFDPAVWATLFAKSGAKFCVNLTVQILYVILTTKHHDGFKLFPSKNSFNWNSYDVGPKRDIVKELSEAVIGRGLRFGVYYSLYEWFNPIYEDDKKRFFKTHEYVNQTVWPDLMQLVNTYNPSIIWVDGDWEANESYWKSQDFISWVYNDSPVRDDVVVNNRWGCKPAVHGDFYNIDERHNQPIHDSIFTKFNKWETSITMDKQLCWCHRREIKFNEIMTIQELLFEVVSTVSCGGNILINVGPTEEGLITPLFEERLLQLGEWLEKNGEAIYGSSPWLYQVDDINESVYYTCIKDNYDPYKTAAPPVKSTEVNTVYAIFLKWPLDGIVRLRNIMAFMRETPCLVCLLGENCVYLSANVIHDEVYLLLPDKAKITSNFAWTLKFISKSLPDNDLGSIAIPIKETSLKLIRSSSRLGSRTGMKSSSKIVSRIGNTSKTYYKPGKQH